MKTNLFNRLCAMACLLAGMVSASPVLAALTGNNFISGPNQMDIWKFSCPAGSLGAYVDISDLPFIGDPALVGVTVVKDGVSQVADPSENNIASPPSFLDNGRGQYHLVYRVYGGPTTGSEDYASNVYCRVVGGGTIQPVSASFRRILNQ
jgi:hypothetical protein